MDSVQGFAWSRLFTGKVFLKMTANKFLFLSIFWSAANLKQTMSLCCYSCLLPAAPQVTGSYRNVTRWPEALCNANVLKRSTSRNSLFLFLFCTMNQPMHNKFTNCYSVPTCFDEELVVGTLLSYASTSSLRITQLCQNM
jgi:hypothetical protein